MKNIMNEEVMEQVAEATTSGSFGKIMGKIGIAVIAASAVGALCYKGVKMIKAKKTKNQEESDSEFDNIKIAEHDFLEDSEEEE